MDNFLRTRIQSEKSLLGVNLISWSSVPRTRSSTDRIFPGVVGEKTVGYLAVSSPPGMGDEPQHLLGSIAQQAACLTVAKDREAAMALDEKISQLHHRDARFNWTGVYVRMGENLQLAAFRGLATPHSVIPISGGICGAAIREGKTLNIPDVSADKRYLSCDFRTKSEIVVPIFDPNGLAIGEIDIDSHQKNAFLPEDEQALEGMARELSPLVLKWSGAVLG